MSDDIAIKVEGVSKTFKLPHSKNDSIKSKLISLKDRERGYEIQQALKDISFEVRKGEFFGIVGRNGSGKSTLLKIISQIYTPDKGTVTVNGKLTPFIELGVGFNPELSGRENVFLNGALLGFSRKEMEALYEDIVAFAELERFMDQKLKNYSSGMQVRLAFSIAIQANTDILVLDEVLAVGDEAFQRKCDDFFKVIQKDKTKTVILVTHSMESINKYCDRAMLIRDSKIAMLATASDVSNQYTLDNFTSTEDFDEGQDGKKPSTTAASVGDSTRIKDLRINLLSKSILTSRDDLVAEVEYEASDSRPVVVHIGFTDELRSVVILNNGTKVSKKGKNKLQYTLPLRIYNNCNLLVNSVVDDAKTKERIAFTTNNTSKRCIIRNKTGNYGLLNIDTKEHGSWSDDMKDFIYDRNGEIHTNGQD